MKKITLLFLPKYNIYELIEWSEKPIGMLGLFLTDMLMYFFPSYIEWATDPTQKELEGNSTVLKKLDNIILVGSLFSDEPDGGPFFTISINQFVKVLQEWEKFSKAKAPQITITQLDNGEITVQGE